MFYARIVTVRCLYQELLSRIDPFLTCNDIFAPGVIKLDTCTLSPVQNRAGVEKPCMELVFSAKSRKWRFTAEKLSDNKRWYAAINNRYVTCLQHVLRVTCVV